MRFRDSWRRMRHNGGPYGQVCHKGESDTAEEHSIFIVSALLGSKATMFCSFPQSAQVAQHLPQSEAGIGISAIFFIAIIIIISADMQVSEGS